MIETAPALGFLSPCLAYIGPGAGFAFLGSFFLLFVALILALVSVLLFPLRFTIGALLRLRRRGKSVARRAVIVGMDGLDPERVRQLMTRGELPHFKALAEQGTFSELETTTPPISPVAWSSFMTGVNPGKHNIFDFLNRDLRTCIPQLSSCRVDAMAGGRSEVELLRKSKPFWRILGENGIFSTVLRVPITFPPEKFRGLSLSGMCVPDIRGTQGIFTSYEEMEDGECGMVNGEWLMADGKKTRALADGGLRIPVMVENGRISTYLPGPPARHERTAFFFRFLALFCGDSSGDGRDLKVPMKISIGKDGENAVVRVCGERVRLRQGEYSDWTRLVFKDGFRRAHGICRFLLLSTKPFRLYVTPINIDPERPVMPISHPAYYSLYLAKLHGPFATLGVAEDTWALSEGVIDDAAYLKQVRDIQKEREEMFFDALKRTRTGLCACVFDLPDRVQHMFFRYVDDKHPARRENSGESVSAIDDAYRAMDSLLGRVMESIDRRTALIVLSDHGFRSFRRGVNLNVWLAQEGYLVRKPGAAAGDYLSDVDWERTRAYSFGLSGIYLNVKGRETRGIVDAHGEKQALKAEIIRKLASLRDPAGTGSVIRAVYDSAEIYSGPYSDNGPDLIVGYEEGYRASWKTAVGRTDGPVFADNTKCWSGDHCIDSSLVPGVFFCNRKAEFVKARPHITDVAPTVLSLFGIEPPSYMDGKAIKMRE